MEKQLGQNALETFITSKATEHIFQNNLLTVWSKYHKVLMKGKQIS